MIAPAAYAAGADQPLLIIPASSAVVMTASNGQDVYVYNPNAFSIFAGFVGSNYQLFIGAPDVSSITVNYKYANAADWTVASSTSVDDGVCHWSIRFNATDYYLDWFATAADFYAAVLAYDDTPDPAAVLVDAGDSFSFGTGYSINNSSDIDIAVATYNLGYNDIIVACSYETLVLPGTIAGMSANYNINTSARDFNIPVRYTTVVSDGTFSSLSPFESLEDAVSACYSILQDSPNHGGGYTPSDVQFTLEPGNVAYIEMADLSEKVILSSSKSDYSALFQTAGSYWPGNQLYKSGVIYPSAGTVLPGATPNQIPWQKNEWGKENLLGQSKQAYAEITASSNLLMIYNPYYQGDDSSTLTNTNLINSTIVISSKGIARNGIRVYNLQDSFSTVDGNYYYGIGSTNPNGYDDYFQSQNDPNATNPDVTGWTDQNGDPTTAPGVTPYNDPPENDSIADVITKFISNITGLFTQGHDAIKTLSENASEFVSHLSELYSWLPPQVLAVLTSAIILAIIIGVLKVFL